MYCKLPIKDFWHMYYFFLSVVDWESETAHHMYPALYFLERKSQLVVYVYGVL